MNVLRLVWVLCALALPARAQTPVDLELVIAADVSISMDREERFLQQQGFVEAFRHPDIVNAIRSGATGRISVAYMEWGGEGRHRLVVPWTLIDDAGSANRFAARLAKNRPARFKGGTSISSALAKAHGLLHESPFSGARRVINISGDGVNNKGPDLEHVRAEVLDGGITINGLPIIYKAPLGGIGDDPATMSDPQLLIGYFERDVVGGPLPSSSPSPP